jgi:hypothetical protein
MKEILLVIIGGLIVWFYAEGKRGKSMGSGAGRCKLNTSAPPANYSEGNPANSETHGTASILSRGACGCKS